MNTKAAAPSNLPALPDDAPRELRWAHSQLPAILRSPATFGIPDKMASNPPAVWNVLTSAHALGIPTERAFQAFWVDPSGKAALYAATALGLARQRAGLTWDIEEMSSERATVVGHLNGRTYRITFTIQDAQRAGLTGKDVWKRYPSDMLLWRALSRLVKFACPDAILGMDIATDAPPAVQQAAYTPPAVDRATGEIIDVPALDDNDIIDAEIVDEHQAVTDTPAAPAMPDDWVKRWGDRCRMHSIDRARSAALLRYATEGDADKSGDVVLELRDVCDEVMAQFVRGELVAVEANGAVIIEEAGS